MSALENKRWGDGGSAGRTARPCPPPETARRRRNGAGPRRSGLRALAALLLAAALLATPALAAGEGGEVPRTALANKPEITIQGNVVVDETGAPTGFYELALCVRSPRRIYGPAPDNYQAGDQELTEAQYAQVLADIAAGRADDVDESRYTITYYPFFAASAVVGVNADVLTAVNWDVEQVTYHTWSGSAYDDQDSAYPRGVDVAASADPEQWGELDPAPFPEVDKATQRKPFPNTEALDAEGDRSVFTATALAEDYDAATKSLIVSLSASAADNKPVIYTTSTPVAVVRFSYDLQRFPAGVVAVNGDYNTSSDHYADQITGQDDAAPGFWLGLDRTNGHQVSDGGKTPVTWLGESAVGGDFTTSDGKAAATGAGQTVWTKLGGQTAPAENGLWDETEFYFYLGAKAAGNSAAETADGTVRVAAGQGLETVEHVRIPKTQGLKVLAKGSAENPQPSPAAYSYYTNLLYLDDAVAANRGLRLRLVNAPTFRPKTGAGAGGNQILFYDWDDTLIGSLVVGDGDLRAAVNRYVEQNLVHPDLRASTVLAELGGELPDLSAVSAATGSGDDAAARYKALLDSDDRLWTYRGKYSATVDGTGEVRGDDLGSMAGKEYPLTNKLDYAFYRRVNTETVLSYQTDGGETVIDRYVTAVPLSEMGDAALYPYAYGWAVVEDSGALNQTSWQVRRDDLRKEEVWTTFGTGELSEADPAAAVADQPIPAAFPDGANPDPAVGDGTGREVRYPAFVAGTPEETAPAGYSYALSSASAAGYLRFADFSDAASLFPQGGRNTLIVKAVYEPGTELMDGSYRMIKEPYYNKLRSQAANNGGAYSVEVTLERASQERPDGLLRGVRRTREPTVRQDTTADQKWIESEEKGVMHDLDNASKSVAQGLKETTFTKVDIDNGDEITFTLALSARQNKIDYWIIDAYGFNFASGGQRSATNFGRVGNEVALDNYNYYVPGDSDETDIYFDPVDYADRDGSRGFVLYGTLNNIMELATKANRSGDRIDFSIGAAYDVLADANIRDSSGNPVVIVTEATVQEGILAAAKACEAHRGESDYWNSDKDCAELSYHQLQLYLIDGRLRDRATADAEIVNWCHLHADCAATMSGTPRSWEELLAAAKGSEPEVIEKLTTGEIERLTHLRQSGTGALFSSSAAFRAALVAAVEAGAKDWKSIQYYILNSSLPGPDDTTAQESYWWYDGATSNAAPGSLSALVAAARDALTPAALPDGTTSTMNAKLNAAQSAFDANSAAAGDAVASAWNRMTENLVSAADISRVDQGEGSTTKFGNFQDFRDALLAAVGKAGSATPDSDPNYWYHLQYVVLHPEASWPADAPGAETEAGREMANYFWHNGGKLYAVKDLVSLLEVAGLVDANPSAQSAWEKFTYATVEGNPDLCFAKDFVGTLYDADSMDEFKAAIVAMVKTPGAPTLSEEDGADRALVALTWRDIQYYLIHGKVNSAEAAREGAAGFYWWQDGGEPTAPNITIWQDFFSAAFMELYNGNTKAWDNQDTNTALMRQSRLRDYDADYPEEPPIYDYASLPPFTTAQLRAAAEAYVQKEVEGQISSGADGHTIPVPTWFQLQHYLKNNTWDLSGIQEEDLQRRYWWYDGAATDPNKPQEAPDQPLKDWIAKFLSSETAAGKVTADDLKAADILFKSTVTGTEFKSGPTLNTAKTRLKNLIKNTVAAGQQVEDLTWYQIQVALWPANAGGTGIGNGSYTEAAAAKAAYESKVDPAKDWRPDWVKSFYDAAGASLFGEASEAETELDQARAAVARIRAALPALRLLAPEAVEEMERALAQAEEELARLEAQATPQAAPTASSTADSPAQAQTSDDHDQRPEIPLGEEAAPAPPGHPAPLVPPGRPLAAGLSDRPPPDPPPLTGVGGLSASSNDSAITLQG